MSLNQRVKQGFLRLPFSKKAILVSSAALMVSTVLPWYDERNSFGIGETYLGVQGPLFLVGLMVLGFGAVTFFNLFFPLMGRNFFNLRKRGGTVALVLGVQALLLLGIANSVFFHPEFGLNVASKGTRFGMMVALFAAPVMVISGWMTRRKESEESDTLETFEEPVREPEMRVEPTRPTVSPVFTPMPTGYSAPQASAPQGASQNQGEAAAGVDPLTLDARTRYRMLQSQQRYSSGARGNLWGGGNGSAYGGAHYGRSGEAREQSMDF